MRKMMRRRSRGGVERNGKRGNEREREREREREKERERERWCVVGRESYVKLTHRKHPIRYCISKKNPMLHPKPSKNPQVAGIL